MGAQGIRVKSASLYQPNDKLEGPAHDRFPVKLIILHEGP
jgi:hypothetical protein